MNRESHVDATPLALVVDDDAALRLLLRVKLEQLGLRVAEAEDGLCALEAFDRLSAQIVMLDIVMPRLDGLATCRE